MFGKKPSLDEARANMVKRQLAARQITDSRILQAMQEESPSAQIRWVFGAESRWKNILPASSSLSWSEILTLSAMASSAANLSRP